MHCKTIYPVQFRVLSPWAIFPSRNHIIARRDMKDLRLPLGAITRLLIGGEATNKNLNFLSRR